MSDGVPNRKFDTENLPRSFMSPAYVEERDPGTFAMYRDILVETDEYAEDGTRLREKLGKRIGPMMILCEAKKGDPVDFMTSRPDGTVLQLTRIHPPRKENES